jgi:hypothetical protein
MNLTGFNISETAINVSWSFIPQKYRHGIIIGYRVHYEDEHRHSESVTVPASQRSITLNHLHSYTLYNISVAGITKIGEGKNRTSVLTYTNPGGTKLSKIKLRLSIAYEYFLFGSAKFSPS